MEKVEWDNTLSVGVKLIDEQHKGLIQRINGVLKAVEEKQEEREIAKTLNFLFDYTHFHFSTEVKHMELNDYPGLEDHKMRHEEFVDTLKNLEKEFKEETARRFCKNPSDELACRACAERGPGIRQVPQGKKYNHHGRRLACVNH